MIYLIQLFIFHGISNCLFTFSFKNTIISEFHFLPTPRDLPSKPFESLFQSGLIIFLVRCKIVNAALCSFSLIPCYSRTESPWNAVLVFSQQLKFSNKGSCFLPRARDNFLPVLFFLLILESDYMHVIPDLTCKQTAYEGVGKFLRLFPSFCLIYKENYLILVCT